jgi:hypothetical protein
MEASIAESNPLRGNMWQDNAIRTRIGRADAQVKQRGRWKQVCGLPRIVL